MLTAAAVLGRDFTLAALEALIEEPVDDAARRARGGAARRPGAPRTPSSVERFAFSHALVRETLYDAARGEPARGRCTCAPARRWSAAGALGPASSRTTSSRAREVGGGERGRRLRRRGGAPRPRRAHAYEEAARQYERALERARRATSASRRTELLLALGDVRWQGGEPGARARVRRRRRSSPASAARRARWRARRSGRRPLLLARAVRPRLRRAARRTRWPASRRDSPLRPHLLGRLAETEHERRPRSR